MPDVYIGDRWAKEMPVHLKDWRICPKCKVNVLMKITAYEDEEYWTCPRAACGAHTTHIPEEGQGVKLSEVRVADRTKDYHDFKRNAPRRYRSKRWRRENEEED